MKTAEFEEVQDSVSVHRLTTSQDPQGGAIILLHPLVPGPDEHANGRGGCIEVSDLQSLDHLPVASCME